MQSIGTQSQFSGRTQTSSESLTKILRTLFADCPSFRDDRITPAKTKQQATNCLNKSFLGDMNAVPFAGAFRHLLLTNFSHITTSALSQTSYRGAYFLRACAGVCGGQIALMFFDLFTLTAFPDRLWELESLVTFCHKKFTICFWWESPQWAPLDGTPPQKLFLVSLRGFPCETGREGKCMRHVSIMAVSEITCAWISLERLRQSRVSAPNNDHPVVL